MPSGSSAWCIGHHDVQYTKQTVALDELIFLNLTSEISVTQLRAQLSHDLETMDGIFSPTGSGVASVVD